MTAQVINKPASIFVRALSILKYVYLNTFPPLGYDPINNTLNGSKYSLREAYLFHWLTIITGIIGVPNRDLTATGKQSFTNIFKNIFGLENNVRPFKTILNFSKLLIVVIWHCVTTPLNFLVNIPKIFTEFLPLLFSMTLHLFASYLAEVRANNAFLTLALSVSQYLLEMGSLFFKCVYLIGRAATSPHKSVRAGWREGIERFGSNWQGWLLGILLSSLSIAITVGFFALLLPIAMKYSIALGIPNIPHMVNYGIPIFSWIGSKVLLPVLGPIFNAIHVAVSPTIVGASAMLGATFASVGTVTTTLLDNVKNLWFSWGKKKKIPSEIVDGSKVVHHQSQGARKNYPIFTPLQGTSKKNSYKAQSAPSLTKSWIFSTMQNDRRNSSEIILEKKEVAHKSEKRYSCHLR